MKTVDLSHPGLLVAGDAQAAAVGQLTDDAIHDAVIQHGEDQLFFLYAVDRRNSWSPVAGAHRHPTLLPDALAPGRDGILTVGPGGLNKLVWSVGTGGMVSTSVGGTGAWSNARQLQVIETSSGYEVLALCDDGTTIRRASWDPATGQITPFGSLLLTEESNELCALQWDTDPSKPEIALTSSTGLYVYELGPLATLDTEATAVFSYQQLNTRSLLGVVPATAGDPVERLAWIHSRSGFVDGLQVFDAGGEVGSLIEFSGFLIAEMAFARLDPGDPRPGLVLFADDTTFAIALGRSAVHGGFQASLQFLLNLDEGNSALPFDFPSGSGCYGPSYPPGPAPVAVCADLDGDGDDDLLLAGHPDFGKKAILYLGTLVDEESTQLGACARAWLPGYTVGYDPLTQTARFRFDDPPAKPTTGPAQLATHVRIVLWTMDAAPGATMNPTAAAVIVEPLSASGMWTQTIPEAVISDVNPDDPNGLVQLEISYLQLAPGTSQMIRAFPAYHETVVVSELAPGILVEFLASPGNGVTPGGTPNRPPISPPEGGTTITTP